ncbi:hypothetical protein KBY76_12430 [Synechococcus sp. GreenBA-s]|nr:hypothetical protein [Synechococcus sp. GreenBA-s]
MTSQSQAELAQFQTSILENPSDIGSWRLLYHQLSSSRDPKSQLVADVVSRLSRADVENEAKYRSPDVKPRGLQATPIFSAEKAQGPETSEDVYSLEQDLQKAHGLADTGAFNEAKRILLKLAKAKTAHIRAWAQYLIAKCLFDQYQLISSLHACQLIALDNLGPPDLMERAADLLTTIEDGINYQIEKCAEHIKPSFYRKQLLKKRLDAVDLPGSAIECYKHYQRTGFKLGISPTPWFNTSFYLRNCPDIARSGCCPFFHYLAAGKKEGRMATEYGSRFSSFVSNQQGLPKDLYEESLCWLKPLESGKYAEQAKLTAALKDPFVLSFSHDCYYESPGGIQLCIQREQKCFEERDVNYLHVFPRQPAPMPLHSRNPQTEMEISMNGIKLGITSMLELSEILKINQPQTLLIHSLLGFSPQDVLDLIVKQCDASKILYWMHDYSALCSSYQLLRNKVTFCAAPPLESAQCHYCFYGNSRAANIDSIKPLLQLNQTELAFPSHAALSAWRNGVQALGLDTSAREHVINHIRLIESESVTRVFQNRLPRIAFLGHPAYAKGWDMFASLVRDPDLFNLFDWFHLGATTVDLSTDIEYLNVNISSSPDAMIEAVRTSKIDFAFVWSQWPETFCLTAYEAVIGGANIITNEGSGNVAAFARSIPYGHVIANDYTSLKSFLLVLTPAKVASLSFPAEVQYEYSDMSAEALS